MTPDQLRIDIKIRRANGESYQKIADTLRISKPAVRRIEHGEKPSKRLAALLNLDPPEPSAKLKATRERREKLNERAKLWGYSSWSNFETEVISGNATGLSK